MTPVAVVIPAFNEEDRIGATVRAAATLPGVDEVIVVDDGSRDGTGDAARDAGASVIRHPRNRGKAAAMTTGGRRVFQENAGRLALFLDADLGGTAAEAGPLITPVADGEADMTIAAFTERVKRGGHGFVVRLSAAGIRRATGWTPLQPLNGQRCLSRKAFGDALPLARGFGAETAMSIDLARKGLRIREVEVPLAHRATGSDWRSQLHRLRQFADVAWALAWRL
jgi:glycosyltransferase involved in cell wall biosynthesis